MIARAIGSALAATLALSGGPAVADGAGDLAALRQQAIAGARQAQQQEHAVVALAHDIDLLRQDAAGRQRDLDGSRPQQAHLLGALEWLAHNQAGAAVPLAAPPVDRRRGALLVDGAAPDLRAEGHALAAEVERVGELRREADAKQAALDTARRTLADEQERLAQLAAQRRDLTNRLLPDAAGAAARAAKLGHDAKDVDELIQLADAATERDDRDRRAHARATPSAANATGPAGVDPTRPAALRAFGLSQSVLTVPAAGAVSRGSDASDGVAVAAPPGGEVVAPFDGRVVYAGPFRDLGLVLIIRHGDLYHSILAGLGRIDVRLDEWVLAGEPVGVMPDASAALHFQFRRAGHPVDPQPWLGNRGEAHTGKRAEAPDGQNGDQRVGR